MLKKHLYRQAGGLVFPFEGPPCDRLVGAAPAAYRSGPAAVFG